MTLRRGIWAILPVKQLPAAKQRLSRAFSPEFRQQLTIAMLSDVLAALARTRGLAGILVVTIDPTAIKLAARYGARILIDRACSGLTEAVKAAVDALIEEGVEGVLTIPGDIPGATAEEFEALLGVHAVSPAFTIVSAHDGGGSNAIICSPPDIIPLRFGMNSFLAHVEAARAHGVEPNIVQSERLGLDIDNPEDIVAFGEKEWSTNTMSFLEDRMAISHRTGTFPDCASPTETDFRTSVPQKSVIPLNPRAT